MALVTPEKFRDFESCWPGAEEWCARCERVAGKRAEWNALDVLGLEDMSVREKVWLVLHPQFLVEILRDLINEWEE